MQLDEKKAGGVAGFEWGKVTVTGSILDLSRCHRAISFLESGPLYS